MLFVLSRIVKVGTNQLKGFDTISSCGIKSRICNALKQQSWICTQAAKHQKETFNPAREEKVQLNPEPNDKPYILSTEQEDFVTQGSAENKLKLNELFLQLQNCRETGTGLPDRIRLEDLRVMLDLKYSKMCRYVGYMVKTQFLKDKQRKKKAEKQTLSLQKKKEKHEYESTMEHPWLESSNLILPFPKGRMSHVYNSNLILGLLFGQKVIIDCSYNSFMDDLCLKLTAKQILFCCYSSRKNRRPFSLHICNLDFDSRLMYYLQKLHPGLLDAIPIGIHSKSYLELFERKKLVYLTPHTATAVDYNPEDIYIIGGYVDKEQKQLSKAKAEKEKLRYASFPLNQYLKWKSGTKNLCLHHCLDILLDVKNTGDWSKALETNVPSRKANTSDDMQVVTS